MFLLSLYNLFFILVLLEYGRNFCSKENFFELHGGDLLSWFGVVLLCFVCVL